MLDSLLSLVVPPLCAGCRAPLRVAADVVCAGCRRALPWLRGPCCGRCALPLGGRHPCPATGRAFSAAHAAVAYHGVARELVGALKFAHARPLAGVMAAHLAAGAVGRLPGSPVVVPVPAHPSRARARGYDQAALLADALGARLDARVVRYLRRGGPAVRQLGASRAQRLAAGRVVVRAVVRVPPRVLLVDDVHTTGATLDACARALRLGGAEEVTAVTWARTLQPGGPGPAAG